jgi:cell division protein FtsB
VSALAAVPDSCYDFGEQTGAVFRKGDGMPVRVRVVAVICIVAVIAIGFTFLFFQKGNTIKQLDAQYFEQLSYQQYLEKKESTLRETLAAMGTDAFIENLARTLYGYMKSDELRFVITNPEALYGYQK